MHQKSKSSKMVFMVGYDDYSDRIIHPLEESNSKGGLSYRSKIL